MKKSSIFTLAGFSQPRPVNSGFTRCRCRMLYTGLNRNNSVITGNALEKLIEKKGYANVPVVAHLSKDEKGRYFVGGHDSRIIISDDEIEIVNECVPFGVIPEDCSPAVESVTDTSGNEKKYFCVDVILWTHRYPIIDAAAEGDIWFNQSMEAVFTKTHEENGVLVVDEFSLSALCLLRRGDENSVEPCFEGAAVGKFSVNSRSFRTAFAAMLGKLAENSPESSEDRTADAPAEPGLSERVSLLERKVESLEQGHSASFGYAPTICGISGVPENNDEAAERYGALLDIAQIRAGKNRNNK